MCKNDYKTCAACPNQSTCFEHRISGWSWIIPHQTFRRPLRLVFSRGQSVSPPPTVPGQVRSGQVVPGPVESSRRADRIGSDRIGWDRIRVGSGGIHVITMHTIATLRKAGCRSGGVDRVTQSDAPPASRPSRSIPAADSHSDPVTTVTTL